MGDPVEGSTPAADVDRRVRLLHRLGPSPDRVAQFGGAWLANGLPPGKLEPMIAELREVAGRDVPVSVFNASSEPEDLEAYAQLDVERVLLGLPTLPEGETLGKLDDLARVAAATR